MNKLYYFITLTFISLVNGYCEEFCFNNICEDLNGNYISECDECPTIYKCSTIKYTTTHTSKYEINSTYNNNISF